MAKSITKKELSEFNLEKIRRFTTKELEKLSNSELPFCYQIGTDVLVGSNKVLKVNETAWRVIDNHGAFIFDFFSRKDAIFYCIALHKKQYHLAHEIQEKDTLLNRLEFEAILYRQRYRQANNKNDVWGIEYYSTQYTETMYKLEQVKKDLKKTLNLTKYIKV